MKYRPEWLRFDNLRVYRGTAFLQWIFQGIKVALDESRDQCFKTRWRICAGLLCISALVSNLNPTLIARFMGPTWDPSGTDRTQVGPMLAPWYLGTLGQKLWKSYEICIRFCCVYLCCGYIIFMCSIFNIHFTISSAKWQLFCSGFDVLRRGLWVHKLLF